MKKHWALVLTALGAAALMVLMCLAGGISISSYPYPTYLLQAKAWLDGMVHLPQNYEFLELAVYEGNYYVSFPPVPSVPMVLWNLIFGDDVPGGLFQKIYAMIGCVLILSELMRTKRMKTPDCMAWAVLLCFGSALLPITSVGAVWYEAQILAFMFAVAAIVALRRQKIVAACLFYALAVGCRPFAVLLGPVLLLMYLKLNREMPLGRRIGKLVPGLITGLCVAAVYAWYNYVRFGNPLEFGHNYLPEFMRAEHGQLSLVYLKENLKDFLFRLPFDLQDGKIYFNAFGFSMFLSCPLFICLIIWVIQDLIRRSFSPEKAAIVLMWMVNIILLSMHRTLGGYQFGARYAVEMLPLAFCYLLLREDARRMSRWECALLFAGLIFNFAGGCLIHV